jgi:hypothetical protein
LTPPSKHYTHKDGSMDEQYLQQFMPPSDLIMGVDFGRAQSHTALIPILKRYRPRGEPYNVPLRVPSPDLREAMWGIKVDSEIARVDLAYEYHVIDAQRLPLGVDWVPQMKTVATYASDVMRDTGIPSVVIAPDRTGVGDGVLEHLYRELEDALAGGAGNALVVPIFIKSRGSYTPNTRGGYNVSIEDLIDNAAVLVQRGMVHFAPDIPLLDHTFKEFLNYKIDKSHRYHTADDDAYAGWGKGKTDD